MGGARSRPSTCASPEDWLRYRLQLRPEERERIAERCAALDQSNGAVALASFIEEMAYSRRVDRP